jgi:DNA-binding winged helix-turn-helix (wHTH) protein
MPAVHRNYPWLVHETRRVRNAVHLRKTLAEPGMPSIRSSLPVPRARRAGLPLAFRSGRPEKKSPEGHVDAVDRASDLAEHKICFGSFRLLPYDDRRSKTTGIFDMTNPLFHTFDGANRATAEASLEFGRFRVLLRQRLLLADGVPIELGARAFDLLLALLEANGSLVRKEQLLACVWPGIVVAGDNLKAQVFALRRALGKDSNFIRTDFGRGYRFTAAVRWTGVWSARQCPMRHQSIGGLFPQRTTRRQSHSWSVQRCLDQTAISEAATRHDR